jgi:hypothetical protein
MLSTRNDKENTSLPSRTMSARAEGSASLCDPQGPLKLETCFSKPPGTPTWVSFRTRFKGRHRIFFTLRNGLCLTEVDSGWEHKT